MTFEEIEKLIKLLDETSIHEFHYETDQVDLKICKNPVQYVSATSAPVSPPVAEESSTLPSAPKIAEESVEKVTDDLYEIISPMVGTFYASPSPDALPFVEAGSKVQKNTVVCMLEAMKLFNQIEAEVNGEIVEICVENGQFVEYGQPLFRVKL